MDNIKVSVIILTYNHFKYIQKAIESVIIQEVTFPFEVIIADDKSSDQTQEVLVEFRRKYPDFIKLILREENVGTTRNLCDAFQKCKGKYLIAFAGDDYWIDSKKLQIQVDWLDTHLDYVGVSHIIESRNNAGFPLARFPNPKIIGQTASPVLFLKGIYFSTSSTMFRNIFQSEKAENYINLITQSRLVEDVSLAMILLDIGKIYVMDRCMAVYRSNNSVGDSNYNSIRNPIQSFQDHIEIYSSNDSFFLGKYDFSRLYSEKAAYPFIWSIKNHKTKLFFKLFKKIPAKAKVISLVSFPIFLIKTSWQKFINVLSFK